MEESTLLPRILNQKKHFQAINILLNQNDNTNYLRYSLLAKKQITITVIWPFINTLTNFHLAKNTVNILNLETSKQINKPKIPF